MRALLLAMPLAACYEPTLTEGLPCSAKMHCPDGQQCDETMNRCVTTIVDGSVVDTADTADSARVTMGLVARWDFNETSGPVLDNSQFGTPLDLDIQGSVMRFAGHVRVDSPSIIISADPATKIINAALASNEVTVEVWFIPFDLNQDGPARIVGSSNGVFMRNFHIAQQGERIEARLRNMQTGLDGSSPTLFGGVLDVVLSHAVLMQESTGSRRLYVNGFQVYADNPGGDLSNWDPTLQVVLANESSNDRPWLGELHLVAVYDQALSAAEVMQNYMAGADAP